MTHDEFYLLSGAYALDALSLEEKAVFETALAESPELALEADELAATAALLALSAVPVQPPASLKASVMAQLATTPQDSRQESSIRHGATPDTSVAAISAIAGHPAAGLSTTESPAALKARSRWFTRPAGILVAAAAAVALFVGGGFVGTALTQSGSNSSQDASASALAELYAASDVQSAHSTIEGGGEATVMWSSRLAKSAVIAQGLASLPSSKTYEAWYINGSTVTPAGTFTPGGDNTTWHVLSGKMAPGDTVGVTVEPAGGSQAPTTTPIISVSSS
ncbi:anti-sigma factor [Subtercola frigoramans]|uniref:Regulator of SigK n=1 Tax=Subtercola frigoramans TaxID=120298 RepID=A0ABS2L4S5_9MICO|nr:anti-sigma factor [Subtercola frigoramans]MBM7471451.1 anti-sigma-K factor RskA [Subtercola frigoramans]